MIAFGMLLVDPDRPPVPGWLRLEHGRIAELHETADRPPDSSESIGGPDRLIVPGFIDAHTHPPQFAAIGCDGMPLLQWLERVVFPAEIWWGRGAAASEMRHALRAMLLHGTTGFAGYLTSHGQSAHDAIAQLLRGPHMRAILGRVAMDRAAPDALTAEDRWRARQSPRPSIALPKTAEARVEISVNPRFAPTCTEELLAEAGWFVQEHPGTVVQTHLAESEAECALAREFFPRDASYTDIYDRFGLLTPQTLLAHCVHLSPSEWDLIAERRAVVVHCPTANLFLRSGLFDLDAARERGVPIALGSDVAGGPDIAMPRVARAMIDTAKARALTVAPSAHIPSPAEAWRMMTEANADALGWSDSGRLATGARADLLVLRAPESWYDEHLVGRLLYNWSPSLIESRVLAGTIVNPATI